MSTFGAQLRAYDNDVIQLFLPFADSTQPIKIQKTLVFIKKSFVDDDDDDGCLINHCSLKVDLVKC